MDAAAIVATLAAALIIGLALVAWWLTRRNRKRELRRNRLGSAESALQAIETAMELAQSGRATGIWPEPDEAFVESQRLRDSLAAGGAAAVKLKNSLAFRESFVSLSDTFWAAVETISNDDDDDEWRRLQVDWFERNAIARNALEQLKSDNV